MFNWVNFGWLPDIFHLNIGIVPLDKKFQSRLPRHTDRCAPGDIHLQRTQLWWNYMFLNDKREKAVKSEWKGCKEPVTMWFSMFYNVFIVSCNNCSLLVKPVLCDNDLSFGSAGYYIYLHPNITARFQMSEFSWGFCDNPTFIHQSIFGKLIWNTFPLAP